MGVVHSNPSSFHWCTPDEIKPVNECNVNNIPPVHRVMLLTSDFILTVLYTCMISTVCLDIYTGSIISTPTPTPTERGKLNVYV